MSFFTILTPLAMLPIAIALLLGAHGCLELIARNYGIDLAVMTPMLHVTGNSVPAPLLLLGTAAFTFIAAFKISNPDGPDLDNSNAPRPIASWLKQILWASVLLGLVTVPYWLKLPLPVVWAAAAGILTLWLWRRDLSRVPAA